MIKSLIQNYILQPRKTLLCVGPMSLNCVNASIELSNEHNILLMLIASRRQIDSQEFGGGYVNNWTTEEFAQYIVKHDKKEKILIARDHGGPWQNDIEINKNLDLTKAMQSAKNSYMADIDSGFHALHIDPSVDIHKIPTTDEILDRVFELYEFCWEHAKKKGKEIIFEIGTEEQSGSNDTGEELDYTLSKINLFCKKNRLPSPTFVVIQTGTKVMEKKNIGTFDSPLRVYNEIPSEIQVPRMIEICNKHGIFMKEHNTDYLSDEALKWHPRLGIHAANVAPEFGVVETQSLVSILETHGLNDLAEKFLDLSYSSKKWEKWMLKDSDATDRERSIIAGHYVFSNPKFMDIKSVAKNILIKKNIDLDYLLKEAIKKAIFRYMINFKLITK
jgi:hypothetical protein